MAFSDAYQILVHQTYGQINILNTMCVERLSPSFGSGDIFTAFYDSVLPAWRGAVIDDLTIVSVDVISLSDLEDFRIAEPVNLTGNGLGAAGPALVAASIRFNRSKRGVRHGYFRLSGLAEDDYNGNSFNQSAIDNYELLAAALSATWFTAAPVESICQLHVVKRVLVPASGTHKAYYRLPENATEYVSYHPETIYVNPAVRSQSSRKLD